MLREVNPGDLPVRQFQMMEASEPAEYEDILDDVFASSDLASTRPEINGELSENTRLRSTHVTNGYRDGIAESKSKYVQDGFDEGYPLGAVLGFKAAWFIKVLEELRAACSAPDVASRLDSTLSEAQLELAMERIISPEYFDEDGIWTFPVPGDADSECDFDHIARHHPLIVKWAALVNTTAASLGLELKSLGNTSQAQD